MIGEEELAFGVPCTDKDGDIPQHPSARVLEQRLDARNKHSWIDQGGPFSVTPARTL